jgi:hypothetical protein
MRTRVLTFPLDRGTLADQQTFQGRCLDLTYICFRWPVTRQDATKGSAKLLQQS